MPHREQVTEKSVLSNTLLAAALVEAGVAPEDVQEVFMGNVCSANVGQASIPPPLSRLFPLCIPTYNQSITHCTKPFKCSIF
jgi:hypothetical protein